jgi:Minimal binding motif of Hap4 for binding to Hap2/3/5
VGDQSLRPQNMTLTPCSTGSSAAIAPAPPNFASKTTIAANMAAMASSTAVPVSSIGPTKTWVIPPRPKPGRKPATDTPPTKRKAQNRAAQRAFRERRAARVGELEEQLKETEEERQKRESAMHDRIDEQNREISRLDEELQRTSADANLWRDRCLELERNLEHERREKDTALVELAYLRNGARSTGTDAVPLPPRRLQIQQNVQSIPISQYTNPTVPIVDPLGCGNCTTTGNCVCVEAAMTIATSGCGKCTPESHCQCLEETLRGQSFGSHLPVDLKRPPSESHDHNDAKRPRFSVEESPQREIDFTTQFSKAKQSLTQNGSTQDYNNTSTVSQPSAESCGFCAEGTYCVCAESTRAMNGQIERDNENRLAPILNEVTPPPSDTDVTLSENTSLKLPSLYPNHWIRHSFETGATSVLPILPRLLVTPTISQPAPGSCTRAPGSCKQCQEDPKSGLFCRSLAAMRASDTSTGEPSRGCCGSATNGGCCKDQKQPSSLSLSCADTYKTLASHKNFDRASDDICDWLPKLQASESRYPGRAPLDIEAASVMNVIKYFDVRFGRE